MYYVYLIKSIRFPDQCYVGFTANIKERLKAHDYGKSIHTAKYIPWILHAYFSFVSKAKAIEFEKYLKSHSGRAFSKNHFW